MSAGEGVVRDIRVQRMYAFPRRVWVSVLISGGRVVSGWMRTDKEIVAGKAKHRARYYRAMARRGAHVAARRGPL